jgi:chromosome partitioning protein
MPVIVVANPKGGVGKSTLSTNIAGYFASQGHPVMLGDADVQQSSQLWLGLRPAAARPITTWEVGAEQIAKPPKGIPMWC